MNWWKKELMEVEIEMEDPVEMVSMDSPALIALFEQVKEDLREEVRAEVEAEIRAEYAAKPVRRGVLGFFSYVTGLIPDSNGKPSGSWTIYVLSHFPPIIITICWCIALLFKIDMKAMTMISPWIVLFPMTLAWVAWLAHHKKLADVAVYVLTALGDAFSGVRGKGMRSAAISAIDSKLTPGKTIEIKKRPKDKPPKTDPNELEVPPS